MTREAAAAFVDTLDEYLDACLAALFSGIARGQDDVDGERAAMVVRGRLVDRLVDEMSK